MYKALGPLSILLVWIAGIFLIRKWHEPGTKTLSQLSAKYKYSYFLFAFTLSIAAIMFYVFCIKWLIPNYYLGDIFSQILFIGLICQFLTGWIADPGKGRQSIIHSIFAYILALTLLPMSVLLTAASDNDILTAIGTFSVSIMIVIWIIFLGFKKAEPYFLKLQVIYMLSFHLLILAAVFLK